MTHRTLAVGALFLASIFVCAPAAAQDVEGTYSLKRWGFGGGPKVTVWIGKGDGRTYTLTRRAEYSGDRQLQVHGTATLNRSGWLHVDFGGGAGITGRLEGVESDPNQGWYKVLSSGRIYGLFAPANQRNEFEFGERIGEATSPDPSPSPTVQGSIELPAKVLAVPGTSAVGRQRLSVKVEGEATLSLSGPARLFAEQGEAVSTPLTLTTGEHLFQLEGTADGAVKLTLQASDGLVATGRTQVTVERLYLVLFGYQGTEIDYLEKDLGKTVQNIVPHLSTYTKIEDGSSYDQSKIDKAINDPNTPRKVLVDWCATRADLMAYLKRGTVRGITWGSHGYMEPWIGCPDSELDLFESRVWSAAANQPESTDKRSFVREWKTALEGSVKTHGKLDFILMHSCCTGGIGSYKDEVWNYTFGETKVRAQRVLGDPLPTHDKLRYTSYDDMAGQCDFLQTYDGPSYFGMWDVSWRKIRDSLNPNR